MRQDHSDEGRDPLTLLRGETLSAADCRGHEDDQLLSGTIADNICFFADAPDDEWMRECAEMAGIH